LKKIIEICVMQGSNRGPLVQSVFYKNKKKTKTKYQHKESNKGFEGHSVNAYFIK